MKVFITGGTGNIGQYVTLAVAEAGHAVSVLTRKPDAYTFPVRNIKLVGGDISDKEKLRSCVEGCDVVIHIALGWGKTPVEMLKNDTEITVFLLEAAERAGVKSFIYTSSTAAMGHMRKGMDETVSNRPLDLYGATKAASEAYVLGFAKYYEGGAGRSRGDTVTMRRNIIRPGYTYSNPAFEGGRTEPDARFRTIAEAVIKNAPVRLVKGDGTQFLSAREIAQLYIKLLESDKNEETYLALGKEFVSWREIAENAIYEAGSDSRIELVGDNGESEPYLFNVGKIERDFGLSFGDKRDLIEHIKWCLRDARERA